MAGGDGGDTQFTVIPPPTTLPSRVTLTFSPPSLRFLVDKSSDPFPPLRTYTHNSLSPSLNGLAHLY